MWWAFDRNTLGLQFGELIIQAGHQECDRLLERPGAIYFAFDP